MDMLEAAIIGLGWWGKRIVNSVQGRSAHLRFVQGVTQEPEGVCEFARQADLIISTTMEEALANPRVRAVVLATPHSLHVAQIVAAAAAGKHVLCEKPLALTRDEAVRAVDACKKAGVMLGLGTNRRYVPAMRELRRIVQSNTLGRLLHIEGNFTNANSNTTYAAWRASDHEAPAGAMTAAGIHMLDALVSLAGPVARVEAQLVTYRAAPEPLDTISVLMRHANGVSANFAAVRASPIFWRVHVFGTEVSAEARGEAELFLHRTGFAPEGLAFDPLDSVHASVDAFARAILGEAEYPVTSASMIAVTAAFEAIVQSVHRGAPVDVLQT
jgi:predicted dehydrogenase